MTIAIRAENLSKRYKLGAMRGADRHLREAIAEGVKSLGRRLTGKERGQKQQIERDFWALKDVNFEIKQGEVVGVIGRNGAGKSTLLKLLSRITDPTEGYAEIRGRVGSLLEVGTGFHPELTGRENIFLNGAILGMTRGEIKAKFDEIVEFAEIAKFIDTPVKRYSSGMYVRLAFAVAAHLEPEILIVDEVLAVGDAAFQKKCLGKMKDVAGHGRTVLFVSHNMATVSSLCTRSLLLIDGAVFADGATEAVIKSYNNLKLDRDINASPLVNPRAAANVTGVFVTGENGSLCLHSGKPADFHFDLTTLLDRLSLTFTVYNDYSEPLLSISSAIRVTDRSRRATHVQCSLPWLPLRPGRYTVNVQLESASRVEVRIERVTEFDVGGDLVGSVAQAGKVYADAYWKFL